MCIQFQYSFSLLVFFLLEMGVAIVGFVFPSAMQATLEEYVTDRIIHSYRDDPDLQNFIDFAQQQVSVVLLRVLTELVREYENSLLLYSSSVAV